MLTHSNLVAENQTKGEKHNHIPLYGVSNKKLSDETDTKELQYLANNLPVWEIMEWKG